MKVLLCDYVGNSAQWIEKFAIKENLEVVGTITPSTDKKLLTENSSWEYLLVFEDGLQKFFLSTVAQPAKISENRIIFALDWSSWASRPTIAYALLNPTGGMVQRLLQFNIARHLNPYITCSTADGFHYIDAAKNVGIIRQTYITRQNFSADEMNLFYQLTKEFYNVDDSDGWFLDLGANIGTSGIYFVKKFVPNLKLLAFEPDEENFKMLKANLILNDVEKNAVVEQYGLGAEDSEKSLYKYADSGAHSFFNYRNDIEASESIKITSLDSYLAKNNIQPEEIKYLWIDTEGFEAQVIVGAQNLLAKNPAPIYTEFSPTFWNKSGYYDKMMEILTKHYTHFIFIGETLRKGNKTLQPIEKLWEFENSTVNRMGAGSDTLVRENIFLIHE